MTTKIQEALNSLTAGNSLNPRPLVIYHSADIDGHCSGYIAKRKFLEINPIMRPIMMPVDYKDKDTFGAIVAKAGMNRSVVMTDFSFPRHYMEALNKLNNFVWIDHHRSAIEEMDGLKIPGIRNEEHAACVLAHSFLYPNIEIPKLIKCFGFFDVWKKFDHGEFEWESVIMPIQIATRSEHTDPFNGSCFFDKVINDKDEDEFDRLLSRGRVMNEYQAHINSERCHSQSYTKVIDDKRFLVLHGVKGSQAFEACYDPKEHDAMLAIAFDGEKYSLSVYNTGQFVAGEYCKQYGGGGHPGAAGFTFDAKNYEMYERFCLR